MAELIVHITDHNYEDRVLVLPDTGVAIAILTKEDKTPVERMGTLWKYAAEQGKVVGNPRVSEMDNADVFLPWPADAFSAHAEVEWRECLTEWLADIDYSVG